MAEAARYQQFCESTVFGVAMPNWLARQSWEIARESASVVYRPFVRRTAADWGRALVSPAGPLLVLVSRLPARCCLAVRGALCLKRCHWLLSLRCARPYRPRRWGRCVCSQMLTQRWRWPVAFETTPNGASFAVLLAFLIWRCVL